MPVETTLTLFAADLHYPTELTVHTASSGAIGRLAARYLKIERSDGFRGIGEIRANIAYLNGLQEDAVTPAIETLCGTLPWSTDPEHLIERLPALAGDTPHVAMAVVEQALLDGISRQQQLPATKLLGGSWAPAVHTNQCLFWGPDELFDHLAGRYVAEGFRDLKVRIAVGDFDHDLARLGRLRDRFGETIQIAVDTNGSWTADEAVQKLARLAPLNISYVEQPTASGDWSAYATALAHAPMPLMLDESLVQDADIERLVGFGEQYGSKTMAHLKIVKLGGPLAVVRAARRLRKAGIGLMIGQMNEGAMATAMTMHCAMAIQPQHAELYGCYGLIDDVTSGVSYRQGSVCLSDRLGTGVALSEEQCRVISVTHYADDAVRPGR